MDIQDFVKFFTKSLATPNPDANIHNQTKLYEDEIC